MQRIRENYYRCILPFGNCVYAKNTDIIKIEIVSCEEIENCPYNSDAACYNLVRKDFMVGCSKISTHSRAEKPIEEELK